MADNGEPQSKKPEDSDFQQQRLKAWQPLLTPKWVIGTFLIICVIFIPIGIAIVVSSGKVKEVEVRYDNLGYNNEVSDTPSFPPTCPQMKAGCVGDAQSCTLPDVGYSASYTATSPQVQNVDLCSIDIPISITEDMNAPVYVYYKLSNYYQNHRRYVKSRSDTQLSGASSPALSTCDPWTNDGTTNAKTYYPCGLIAGSFFFDRFSMNVQRNGATVLDAHWWETDGTNPLGWTKTGIAWSSDKSDKFKVNEEMYADHANYNHQGIFNVTLPRVDDEDFIVWMRTAGLPTFKKLYRKINVDLKAGDTITMRTLNYYPVRSFSGQKAIVLSTTSWLGGKNSFLGWAYIVVGIICFVLAIAFAIKHAVSPRPLGDMRYFNFKP